MQLHQDIALDEVLEKRHWTLRQLLKKLLAENPPTISPGSYGSNHLHLHGHYAPVRPILHTSRTSSQPFSTLSR